MIGSRVFGPLMITRSSWSTSQPEQPVGGELCEFTVGRLQHGLGGGESPQVKDWPEFGEGQKAFVAMVVPHAACANASKGRSCCPSCMIASLTPTLPESTSVMYRWASRRS